MIHINRWSQKGNSNAVVQPNYAQTGWANKYHALQLPIVPKPNGIYSSKMIDGKMVTEFTFRNGKKATTDGLLLLADDQRAYLVVAPLNAPGKPFDDTPAKWYEWVPGSAKKQIPVPPGDKRPLPFGPFLIVQKEIENSDSQWLIYDSKATKWSPLPDSMQQAFLPYQTVDAFYRVDR
ncbi:hypothetical protein [Paenibacillus eucommiae]|uniref:Uncharacterized protein n=1 Tax=Paenibacillus eucommiae TaxID=1355755 RepID=A0ABS4J884_9BACL|nr:hypothetical protein [Paenibacillus eucommiae]MBP1996047.1 hypothetical protein [Paenibacillus eucommiae]